MDAFEHTHNLQFSSALGEVYARFQERLKVQQPDSELCLEQDGMHFMGAWTGLEDILDHSRLRRSIGALFNLTDYRVIQVVGDSGGAFSFYGLNEAKRTIDSVLSKHSSSGTETVLEYGFTASKHDANWVVNDLITSRPDLATRTVGNVVHMSATAIEEWGCEAINSVNHFVLAYNECETAFGGDIWLSDSVMTAECDDVLICLEGGPQTFVQAVNVLLKRVHVVAVSGPSMRAQRLNAQSSRFSAARLLVLLSKTWGERTRSNLTEPDEVLILQTAASKYLDTVPEFINKHNATKRALIDQHLQRLWTTVEVLQNIETVELG